MGVSVNAWFLEDIHLRTVSSEPTTETSDRYKRTNKTANSHSFRDGSSVYAPQASALAEAASIPMMCASVTWLTPNRLAVRITAVGSCWCSNAQKLHQNGADCVAL